MAALLRRVALIIPHTNCLTISPPMQLGYLASSFMKEGWEIRIYDFTVPGANTSTFMHEIVDWMPGMIGISAKTIEFESAKKLVRDFKSLMPETRIVLGGVHPTALPEDTLRESGADFVVRGEGEITAVRLGDLITGDISSPAEVRGIGYLSNGDVHLTEPQDLIQDLDSVPFPAWELIPPARYSLYPWQIFKRRDVVAPVLTSRGCPYSCTFCATKKVHGKKVRPRSPLNVVSEMELLVRDFSVGEFHIMDDNFTVIREHAARVCEEITKKDLGIIWKTPNGIHVDTVDEELIVLMKESGCYQIGFGIESGSREILRRCKKKLDLSLVGSKIAIAKKHGIEVYGFFILGLPGETMETVEETLSFMRRGFDHVNVAFCIPYPGSEIFSDLYAKGEPIKDWNRFIHYNPFPLSSLTEKELKSYMRKAILGFYINPVRGFRLLRKLRLSQVGYVFSLIRKYLHLGR
ncbi:MAG: radical SAM protein [bacterium]